MLTSTKSHVVELPEFHGGIPEFHGGIPEFRGGILKFHGGILRQNPRILGQKERVLVWDERSTPRQGGTLARKQAQESVDKWLLTAEKIQKSTKNGESPQPSRTAKQKPVRAHHPARNSTGKQATPKGLPNNHAHRQGAIANKEASPEPQSPGEAAVLS